MTLLLVIVVGAMLAAGLLVALGAWAFRRPKHVSAPHERQVFPGDVVLPRSQAAPPPVGPTQQLPPISEPPSMSSGTLRLEPGAASPVPSMLERAPAALDQTARPPESRTLDLDVTVRRERPESAAVKPTSTSVVRSSGRPSAPGAVIMMATGPDTHRFRVPEGGLRLTPGEAPAPGVAVAMHVAFEGGETWVSVAARSEGVELRHGAVVAGLSPVPLPLRPGSIAVNGDCRIACAPSGKAMPRFEVIGVDPTGVHGSVGGSDEAPAVPIVVAAVLECLVATVDGPPAAADLVALAYSPHGPRPLDAAVQRARRCASYGVVESSPWNLLVVRGPDLESVVVDSPILEARMVPPASTRRAGSHDDGDVLLEGDLARVAASSSFPPAPVIPAIVRWSLFEQGA